MATSYTRRVNLYINDKEVRNDIASINAEMRKLQNQQRRLAIGSKEYVESGKKIRALRSVINQHNQQLRATEQRWYSLHRIADKVNHYFNFATATIASFAGIGLVMKSAIDEFAEFDDTLADAMKTTKLSREQIDLLNQELAKVDTRTAQK